MKKRSQLFMAPSTRGVRKQLVSTTCVNDSPRRKINVMGVEEDDETLLKRVKSVEDDDVDLFVRLILEGKWDEGLSVLPNIGGVDENIIKSASLVILEQKYFALLGEDKTMDALAILREEIHPRTNDIEKLGDLALLLSYKQAKSHIKASKKKPKLQYHKNTLDKLCKMLMIPERRILVDAYRGARDHAPSERLQVLLEHKDKIQFLQFSHNGKYLASSSCDLTVIVWEVMLDGHVSLKHRLCGHQKPVSFISWSPNDDQIVTCGVDEVVRRWDIASGQCLHIYQKSNSIDLVSCAWSHDGKKVISGANDGSICVWDLEGNEVECHKDSIIVGTADLGIIPTSNNDEEEIIVSVCKENMILLSGLKSNSETRIEEDHRITSFSLSQDGKLLLVTLSSEELHLWNTGGFIKLLADFKGRHRCFRSCIGGMDNGFIAGGSEDSRVYIWHRLTGELISELFGHTAAVKYVSWNPTNPHILASGSDDCSISIWGKNING